MSSELKKSFDYSLVEKDTKGKLIWYAGEIQKQGKTHVESGIEIGRLLSESRGLLDGESFKSWVERECGCSVRSAYNYISAYENFGSCANVAHIELSAMYALTKNKSARKAALEMAKRGKTVTHEIAKELISKHSEKRSETGKPGGAVVTSSNESPVEDGPVASQPAAVSEESEPETEPEPIEDSGKEFKTQKSKTIKTCEALMRAVDDLHRLKPRLDDQDWAMNTCKGLLQSIRNW